MGKSVKKPKTHSAVPSALGYYHQGMYALVVLLKGEDGSAVSVETEDDVVRHDSVTSLHQLKHSTGNPPPLTLKDDGFWNTIGIWKAGPFDGSVNFIYVTCAPLAPTCELSTLTTPNSDRTALLKAMETEAARVKAARAAAKAASQKLPYAGRADGCEGFLKLTAAQRKKLLTHSSIVPSSFTAAEAPSEVEKLVGGLLLPTVRSKFIEHLIAWWDRQVVLSLLGKRPRRLTKAEVQRRVQDMLVEHSDRGLPDSFSESHPPALDKEIGRLMEQQILWVNGQPSRVNRAALARWRARNQRQAWLDQDFAAAAELKAFDQRLKEVWDGRFGPMKDDCAGKGPGEHCERGLEILDWSHHNAHEEVRRIRPDWSHAFLVQGSYQQLAEEAEVGWHPDFVNLVAQFKAKVP